MKWALSKGLSSLVVAAIQTHRVVDGEPRVLPAQQRLGGLRRDQVKFEEQSDRALAQALGQARRIVDGQVWSLCVNAGERNWKGVTSSADGARLAAVDGNGTSVFTSP